jgi:hypothetical protein
VLVEFEYNLQDDILSPIIEEMIQLKEFIYSKLKPEELIEMIQPIIDFAGVSTSPQQDPPAQETINRNTASAATRSISGLLIAERLCNKVEYSLIRRKYANLSSNASAKGGDSSSDNKEDQQQSQRRIPGLILPDSIPSYSEHPSTPTSSLSSRNQHFLFQSNQSQAVNTLNGSIVTPSIVNSSSGSSSYNSGQSSQFNSGLAIHNTSSNQLLKGALGSGTSTTAPSSGSTPASPLKLTKRGSLIDCLHI